MSALPASEPPTFMAAVEAFADLVMTEGPSGHWFAITCTEADALAVLLRACGYDVVAEQLLVEHASFTQLVDGIEVTVGQCQGHRIIECDQCGGDAVVGQNHYCDQNPDLQQLPLAEAR